MLVCEVLLVEAAMLLLPRRTVDLPLLVLGPFPEVPPAIYLRRLAMVSSQERDVAAGSRVGMQERMAEVLRVRVHGIWLIFFP